MKDLDRELLYKLEVCNSRIEMESLIESIDDDDISILLSNQYKQILKFNKDEKLDSIRNILIYKYRKYCKEYKEKECSEE